MNHTQNSTFSKIGKAAFFQTTNSEYGSPWVQDGIRPEVMDIKIVKVPTYS